MLGGDELDDEVPLNLASLVQMNDVQCCIPRALETGMEEADFLPSLSDCKDCPHAAMVGPSHRDITSAFVLSHNLV